MTPQEFETWWGQWTPEAYLADYLDTNGGGREGDGVADKTMGSDEGVNDRRLEESARG